MKIIKKAWGVVGRGGVWWAVGVWGGLVWCGVVWWTWRGVVWFGVMCVAWCWCGVEWSGVECCGVVRCGMLRRDTAFKDQNTLASIRFAREEAALV